MKGGNFRYTVWDPAMIISQIVTLQCFFYVSLGLWIFAFDLMLGEPRSLDQIFKYQSLLASTSQGKFLIAAFLCNALTCSLSLWYVVQRTKLCLDFTCTIHLLHVLACWYYSGAFATSLSWWFINLVCLTLTCVCSEFLCMRTELRAIPVTMAASNAPKVDL